MQLIDDERPQEALQNWLLDGLQLKKKVAYLSYQQLLSNVLQMQLPSLFFNQWSIQIFTFKIFSYC